MVNIPSRIWYRSINVVVGAVTVRDATLFGLLPLTNGWEEYHSIQEMPSLPALLRELGIFKSSSEAINNGYKGPIPPGYTELKFKNYRNVYILNTFKETEDGTL